MSARIHRETAQGAATAQSKQMTEFTEQPASKPSQKVVVEEEKKDGNDYQLPDDGEETT